MSTQPVGALALRLRSTGECVDLAIAWLRTDYSLFFRASRLWWALSLITTLLLWYMEPYMGIASALILGSLAQAPMLVVAAARAAGQPVDTSLKEGLLSILRLLASSIPWGLITGIGLLFFPISAWSLVRSTFLPETVLVEQTPSLLDTARRLSELGNRAPGRALVARLWQLSLILWGALAGELGGQFLVRDLFQSGEPFGTLWEGEITPYLVLGIWASTPIWALLRFVLYLDMRTRSESLDVFFALWRAGGRS
jgi:hypothetical protein